MHRILLCTFLLLGSAETLANTTFTYQGQLQDGNGPVDDTVVMEFFLYDTEDATTPLGSDDPRAVTVTEGLFQTELDFGQQSWADVLWLEIVIDNDTPLPRQRLTGVPLALGVVPGSISDTEISASSVGAAEIKAGEVQRRVDGVCAAGNAIGTVNQDGTVDCEPMPDDYWALGGNAVDGSQFIGTTNAEPLVLRTADVDSLRIEPSDDTHEGDPATVNIIAGSHANSVADGVQGATISGGGVLQGAYFGTGESNRVYDDFSSVGGGFGNTAGNDDGDPLSHVMATVSGGMHNTASGNQSTVGGGTGNIASGLLSTVPGGVANCAGGNYSVAMGRGAKVRPQSDPEDATACAGLSDYSGDSDGDEGSFVWADSQDSDFISTGPNQFLVRAEGGVGVGTNSPRNQLDVVRDKSGSALNSNHVMTVHNTATSQGNVLALQTGADTPGTDENFITFKSGNSNVGAIEGTGSGGVTLSSGSADFAEYLPKSFASEEISPGDVVGLAGSSVSLRTENADRAMVVSTRPIVTGNDPGIDPGARERHVPVAFLGQVPVRVSGPVETGDYLVPSGNNDGTALAVSPAELSVDESGLVIGRALDASGPGEKVLTLVGLPQSAIVKSLIQQRDLRLARIEDKAGAMETRVRNLQQVNDELSVELQHLAERNSRLKERVQDLARLQESNQELEERLATLEALLLEESALAVD